MTVRKRCLLWDWSNTDRSCDGGVPAGPYSAMDSINFDGPISSVSNWSTCAPPELRGRAPFRPMVRSEAQLSGDDWNNILTSDQPIIQFFHKPEYLISPEHAADLWFEKMVPLRKTKGKQLVSPSCSNDPAGHAWIADFMDRASSDPPDFLGLCLYETDASPAIRTLEFAHKRYPKQPIVVSEIGYVLGGWRDGLNFTAELVNYMDSTPWVFEYGFLNCMRHIPQGAWLCPSSRLMRPDGGFTGLMYQLMNDQPFPRPEKVAASSNKVEEDDPDKQVDAVIQEAEDTEAARGPRLPSENYTCSCTRCASTFMMSRLFNVQGGLTYKALDLDDVVKNKDHSLHEFQSILETVNEFSQGIGIVPSAMKPNLESRYPLEFRYLFRYDQSSRREGLGTTPARALVEGLLAATRECELDQEHEPGWSCAVHWPVLDLARKLSKHENSLRVKNIATAKMVPTFATPILEPVEEGSGFVVVLQPSKATKEGFRKLDPLPKTPSGTFNQTGMHIIVDKPIALSIVTKSSNSATDEGLPQLSTWVCGQYTKLGELTAIARKSSTGAPMPALPLIIAQGASWTFYAASQDVHRETTVWKYHQFGKTDTALGCYQVIATLQLLMNWAETQYRPWFEANALDLTSKKSRGPSTRIRSDGLDGSNRNAEPLEDEKTRGRSAEEATPRDAEQEDLDDLDEYSLMEAS